MLGEGLEQVLAFSGRCCRRSWWLLGWRRSDRRATPYGVLRSVSDRKWKNAVGHGQHRVPDPRPPRPARGPPLLAGHRARRPPRGVAAHPAPRRRPAAGARLPGGGGTRRRRRLPARRRQRRCRRSCSTTTRPSRSSSGCTRPPTAWSPGVAESSVRALAKTLVADAAAAAPPRRRAARRDRARLRRGGAARRSRPRCSTRVARACRDETRLAFSYTARDGAATRALRRAVPAGRARAPLVPARVRHRPRRLAQLPRRPHGRDPRDGRSVRAAPHARGSGGVRASARSSACRAQHDVVVDVVAPADDGRAPDRAVGDGRAADRGRHVPRRG